LDTVGSELLPVDTALPFHSIELESIQGAAEPNGEADSSLLSLGREEELPSLGLVSIQGTTEPNGAEDNILLPMGIE
jgi:hypothetical protein